MQRAVQIGTAADLRMAVIAGDKTTEANGTSRDELDNWSGVMSVPVPLAAASQDSTTSSMRPPSPSYNHHRTHDSPTSPLLHDMTDHHHDNDNDRGSHTPMNGSPMMIRLNSVSTTSTRYH